MIRQIILIWFFIITKCKCRTEEEKIDYYKQLIAENVIESNNFIPPNFYEEFVENDKEKQAVDFGSFDFIIVGGGTAGSLLANRISEVEEWSVLLIEAGKKPNEFIDIPGVSSFLLNSSYNWNDNTTVQNHTCIANKGICHYPRGKGLGGSTLINDNIFARGNPLDYEQWSEDGLDGWSFEEILPFFKKYENATSLSNIDIEYHGFMGELKLENYKSLSEVSQKYVESLENLGYRRTDFNGENLLGFGTVQQAVYNGRRQHAAKIFIDPIQKRSNFNLITNSLATKLLIDDSKVIGVEFITNHTKFVAYTSKELIVSAGNIGSSQLLMLSGIGPSEDLQNLNITVKNDLPVGEFFQDQCSAGFQASTNFTFNNSLDYVISQFLRSEGPLTSSAQADIYTFNNFNNDSINELIFIDGFGLQKLSFALEYINPKIIGLYNLLLHPNSFGTIKLSTNNPLDYPTVNPNCLSDEKDVELLVDALELSLSVISSEPLKIFNVSPINNVEFCSNYDFGSREFWRCLIKYEGFPAYHGIGSCKMGVNKSNSVVNNRLIVHGIENLRVIDASVIPRHVSGHLFATVYMIAEKGADMIKHDNLVQYYYYGAEEMSKSLGSKSETLYIVKLIVSLLIFNFITS